MTIKDKQLAIDLNSDVSDIISEKNIFILGTANDAMRYQAREDGIIIVRGSKLMCRMDNQELLEELRTKYQNVKSEWFGEFKNLMFLQNLLNKYGYEISNYSPCLTLDKLQLDIDPSIRIIEKNEISQFQDNKDFKECFIFEDQDPDLLGVAYYAEDKVIALAGCNQNAKHAVEIGVQVLKDYQGKGLAGKLVKSLNQILAERYPDLFAVYGTQFTHRNSINVGYQAGFKLDWVDIPVKKRISQ